MTRFGGWYRGWNMIGLGIVMVMLSVGSVLYGYSIYVTPVSEDLGLSRETANSGIVFQHLGTAALTPFIGRLLDKFSLRLIVGMAGIALGGSLIGLAIGDVLWPKAMILAFPLSFGFQGAGSIASYVLVARWFKLHRGRAMAIVALGQSAGSVFFAPFIAGLIANFGWRQALTIQGVVVMIALLFIAWAIAERPRDDESEPPGKAVPISTTSVSSEGEIGQPLALRDIVVRPVFWVMAAIVAATLAIVQAVIASLVPLATGREIALVQATTLLSFLGMAGLTGKVILAVIADRIDRRTLLLGSNALILLFTLSLTLDLGYGFLVATCVLGGFAVAGFFPIYSAMLADEFGAHSLGTTEGLVSPMIAISAAVAIYAAGISFDATGDYRQILFIFSAVLGGALLLAIGLRFFRPADKKPQVA